MKYIKATDWPGGGLRGEWLVSAKIDGVRAFFTDEGVHSRNGKPLYNLDHIWQRGIRGDYEIFLGDFASTVSAVRTSSVHVPIDPVEHVFQLNPLDERLVVDTLIDPPAEIIKLYMEKACAAGFEGLILRKDDTWYKCKPLTTYDVKILDIVEGKGRHEGRLGAFVTERGNVGIGFSDSEREQYWTRSIKGMTIEVSCMQLTPDGKFRFPRFVRLREDK